MLNDLSRTLLKLGLPGVPDLYQGNEVWTFSPVDPDKRRPVDFVAQMVMLEELEVRCSGRDVHVELLEEMRDNVPDGRAKLYLNWRALDLRRRMAAFFRDADYIGLQADGARDRHVVAYARQHNGRNVVYAAARWYRGIAVDRAARPCGAIWDGTWLAPSGDQGTRTFRDLLSGVTMVSRPRAGRAAISAADLFAHWSVALLVEQPP